MYYSLFVFRFYYKIISLFITRLWPAGMGGPGPYVKVLCWAWAGPVPKF